MVNTGIYGEKEQKCRCYLVVCFSYVHSAGTFCSASSLTSCQVPRLLKGFWNEVSSLLVLVLILKLILSVVLVGVRYQGWVWTGSLLRVIAWVSTKSSDWDVLNRRQAKRMLTLYFAALWCLIGSTLMWASAASWWLDDDETWLEVVLAAVTEASLDLKVASVPQSAYLAVWSVNNGILPSCLLQKTTWLLKQAVFFGTRAILDLRFLKSRTATWWISSLSRIPGHVEYIPRVDLLSPILGEITCKVKRKEPW